jgi:hypothetical protein
MTDPADSFLPSDSSKKTTTFPRDMNLGRRQFLGCIVASTTALAGCAAFEQSDDSGGGDGGGGSETVVDATRVVDEDGYVYWEFSYDQPVTVSWQFTVRDGPSIDIFLVSQSEFSHYEQGERFRTFESSLDSTAGSESVTLEEGEYVLVLDNTSAGEAAPPTNFDEDPAEVEIEITVS